MQPNARRTALVTGGRRRVGRRLVETLAQAGFDVLYTTREPAPPPTASISAVTLDVGDLPAAADALAREVATRFAGRLDVLIHNASAYAAGDLATVSLDQLRLMHRVHVEAPVLITQRLADALRAARGHVITMLDITAVDRPMPSYLAYCATKAALSNVTISLARALSPEVTVNGIAPGVVDWPDDMQPEDREAYLLRVPLARAGTPDDVAGLVRYLVTEGSYITGQILRVDGGRSII